LTAVDTAAGFAAGVAIAGDRAGAGVVVSVAAEPSGATTASVGALAKGIAPVGLVADGTTETAIEEVAVVFAAIAEDADTEGAVREGATSAGRTGVVAGTALRLAESWAFPVVAACAGTADCADGAAGAELAARVAAGST
jgi:hypothetical protein